MYEYMQTTGVELKSPLIVVKHRVATFWVSCRCRWTLTLLGVLRGLQAEVGNSAWASCGIELATLRCRWTPGSGIRGARSFFLQRDSPPCQSG
ncbi:hypothetical protein Trydic_g13188 [Trypoxylus dichotomus]